MEWYWWVLILAVIAVGVTYKLNWLKDWKKKKKDRGM